MADEPSVAPPRAVELLRMHSGLIIFNPVAGRGRAARHRKRLQEFCRHNGWTFWETSPTVGAEWLAGRAVEQGFHTLVAAGGDGTLSQVLNGAYSAAGLDQLPVLGLIPLGSGNDFARAANVPTGPKQLEAALSAVKAGYVALVDVGRITPLAHEFPEAPEASPRLFLNISGFGFDALVAQRVNATRHHWLWRNVKGATVYLGAALAELVNLRTFHLTLHSDTWKWEGPAHLCAVANSPSYGGGMLVAPTADISDGVLDVCVVQEAGRREFVRALPGVFQGKHAGHPRVSMLRARRLTVSTHPGVPLLLDGEVLPAQNVMVDFAPVKLRLLVPGPRTSH